MTPHEHSAPSAASSASKTTRSGGWTPERRARQAALISRWQPWRRSTGPRSEAGKARSAKNALKHGLRSRAHIERMRQVRCILRLSARNLAIVRTWLRTRAAGAEQDTTGLRSVPPCAPFAIALPANRGGIDNGGRVPV